MAIYAATRAVAGTGDVWAMNPLVTQEPGSGAYAAQGIELDFNNNNAHRGDADAGAGLLRACKRDSEKAFVSHMSHKELQNRSCISGKLRPFRHWSRKISINLCHAGDKSYNCVLNRNFRSFAHASRQQTNDFVRTLTTFGIFTPLLLHAGMRQ